MYADDVMSGEQSKTQIKNYSVYYKKDCPHGME